MVAAVEGLNGSVVIGIKANFVYAVAYLPGFAAVIGIKCCGRLTVYIAVCTVCKIAGEYDSAVVFAAADYNTGTGRRAAELHPILLTAVVTGNIYGIAPCLSLVVAFIHPNIHGAGNAQLTGVSGCVHKDVAGVFSIASLAVGILIELSVGIVGNKISLAYRIFTVGVLLVNGSGFKDVSVLVAILNKTIEYISASAVFNGVKLLHYYLGAVFEFSGKETVALLDKTEVHRGGAFGEHIHYKVDGVACIVISKAGVNVHWLLA